MKLKILGTGSKGNAYILSDSNDNHLIIEAGVPAKIAARACGYISNNIKGLLVSHGHGDHDKHLHSYGMSFFGHNSMRAPVIETRQLSPYRVEAFQVHHDVETLGFVITHPDAGVMVYASDLRHMPYRFSSARTLMVECNYSEEMLAQRVGEGRINGSLASRIRENHMSIERLEKYIRKLNPGSLQTVVLLHLSDANSDEEMFKRRIQRACGCRVYVADNGKEFEI